MTARIIDGKAAAADLRPRVARGRSRVREHGQAGARPRRRAGRRASAERRLRPVEGQGDAEAGMESFEHAASRRDDAGRSHRAGRPAECDDPRRRNPRPASASEACRRRRWCSPRSIPAKDVDGFHPVNVGRLSIGPRSARACTPLGCLYPAEAGAWGPQRQGSGCRRPVQHRRQADGALLLQAKCTVTVAHSRTRDLPDVVRRADIVVAAVGRPELIRGRLDQARRDRHRRRHKRVEQPTELASCSATLTMAKRREVAGAITPVPGGVGPMTIACLLRNTVVAAHRRAGLPDPEGL